MRTNMTKFLSALLAIVMLISIIAACFVTVEALPETETAETRLDVFKAGMRKKYATIIASSSVLSLTETEMDQHTEEAIHYFNTYGSEIYAAGVISAFYENNVSEENSSAMAASAVAKLYALSAIAMNYMKDEEIAKAALADCRIDVNFESFSGGIASSDVINKVISKYDEAAVTGNVMTMYTTILSVYPALTDEIAKVLELEGNNMALQVAEFKKALLSAAFGSSITLVVKGEGSAKVDDVAICGELVSVSSSVDYYHSFAGMKVYKTGDESKTVEVSGNKFVMPGYDVTVEVSFEETAPRVIVDYVDSSNKAYSRSITEYDSVANKLSFTGFYLLDDEWIADSRNVRDFDGDGKTTKTHYYFYFSDTDEYSEYMVYENVYSGALLSQVLTYEIDGAKKTLTKRVDYEYDGNDKKETYLIPSGSELVVESTYTSTTEASPLCCTDTVVYLYNPNPDYSYKTVRQYYAPDFTTESVNYIFDEGVFVETYSKRFDLDCFGRVINEVQKENDKITETVIYTYDKFGNNVRKDYYDGNGNLYRIYNNLYDLTYGTRIGFEDWDVVDSKAEMITSSSISLDRYGRETGFKSYYKGNVEYGGNYYFEKDITVPASSSGVITVKAKSRFEDTVNVEVTPDEGYELDKLSYTVGTETVDIIPSDGIYSFVMPDADVTVTATFKKTVQTLFNEYKASERQELETLVIASDAIEIREIVSTAIAQLDGVAFDPAKSLEDNKAAIDAVTSGVPASLAEARETYRKSHSPEIVNGAGQEIDLKKADVSASFTSEADVSEFVKVVLDGADLDTKYYDVDATTLKVTLKSALLKTLNNGQHSVVIVSANGQATANFTVTGYVAPATGDSSRTVLWIVLAVCSFGAAVITIRKKAGNN